MNKIKKWVEKQEEGGVKAEETYDKLLAEGWERQRAKKIVKEVYTTRNQTGNRKWVLVSIIVLSIGVAVALGVYYQVSSPLSSGSVTSPSNNTQKTSLKGCGTDLSCFLNAARSCDVANLTHNYTTNVFGIKVTTVQQYEIQGGNTSNCKFYEEIIDQTYAFSQEIREQTSKQQRKQSLAKVKESSTRSVGKSATCTYNSSEIIATLESRDTGNFSMGFTADFTSDSQSIGPPECNGSLYSINTTLQKKQTAEGVTIN